MATKKRKRNENRIAHYFLALGVIGIFCVIGSSVYLAHQQWKYSFNTPPVSTIRNQKKLERLPILISIASIQLSLPIEEGSIVNGVWHVSDHRATHLAQSALPDENGNIVLYGHNTSDVFGRLHTLKPNDVIDIMTYDHSVHSYVITKKMIVPPTQVNVVNPTETETLTIYTCIGFFDSQRIVIQAKPMDFL